MKMWKDFPNLRKLFDRIYKHRKNCKGWQSGTPCFDCHYDTLTKIEEELGLK